MSASPLMLHQLLAPQYLLGLTLPEFLDRIPKFLLLEELRSVYDDNAIVYLGTATFTGDGDAPPVLELAPAGSGSVLRWEDVQIQFRLTLPRDGASLISTAAGTLANPPINNPSLRDLFDEFGPVEQNPALGVFTEYPGIAYRLELLVSTLTFHLPADKWLPGKIEAGRIVPDPDLVGREDVRFILPKMLFELTQPDDPTQPPEFHLKSWGNSGFDAPADVEVGEVVRMVPPLAVDKRGRWGFGVDQVLVDLSPDSTPPEILELYGADEAFEGLFFKQLRFYLTDKNKDMGFNIAMRDWLIDFNGDDSFKFSLDILGKETRMEVDVTMHNGSEKIEYNRGSAEGDDPNVLTGGSGSIPNTGMIRVHIQGGTPPYIVAVTFDDGTDRFPFWDSDEREARISPGMFNHPPILHPPSRGHLEVTVEDSTPGTAKTFSMTLDPFRITAGMPVGAEPEGLPADRPESRHAAALRNISPALPAGYRIEHSPAASGTLETITISGPGAAEVHVNGSLVTLNSLGQTQVEVLAGVTDSSVPLEVTFPADAGHDESFFLFFQKNRPREDELSGYISSAVSDDTRLFSASRVVSPADAPDAGRGPSAFQRWLQNHLDHTSGLPAVTLEAHASFESNPGRSGPDRDLSTRRRQYALALINGLAVDGGGSPHGHDRAQAAGHSDDPSDRVVEVTGTVESHPGLTVTAELFRQGTPAVPEESHDRTQETIPEPDQNEPPPWFRRFSIEVFVERGSLTLLRLSGTVDFETELEGALRNPDTENLELRQRERGNASETVHEDGVVDFLLEINHDPATHQWTEILSLGAGEGDRNGLLEMTNTADDNSRLKNALGAMLVFAPVINSAAAALDPDSAGSWAVLGGSLAVPASIGALNIFQTRTVTLFGGELLFREYIPEGADALLTDFALMFDYGVSFEFHIDLLDIHSTKPLKVRYKAIGLNLHFPHSTDPAAPGVVYQPVFDTSKGYELELSDPGLFNLPSPLGDLLEIAAVRIVRQNPLTIELDLGLKVDLGVITVDQFRVRVPLLGPPDPLPAPTLLPTGVKVDLSNVLVGEGSLIISENRLAGSLDITLVQLKLRIAAVLSVETDEIDGRTVTAVFASLVVDFPSPIILGASGLGIFGLSGLFAMHYKRIEAERQPGDSVGPALRWLVLAGGEPTRLESTTGVALWGLEVDRWSFGVGLLLGTLEGGFLVNMRGMFVLELPGPRILIFVNIKVVQEASKLNKNPETLTVGILGVIDLDFQRNTLTVGIVIDYEVKDVVAIKLPIELFFNLKDGSDWHLHVGTFESMVTAQVLGIVRARGYFMIGGSQIILPIQDEPLILPGIAVATGIEASITIGDTDIGLYLRIAVGAHIGISFSPFFMAGLIFLEGELRLFIVSLEAHGRFFVEAPDPTYVHGEVCGKVDFFFFSIEGCVDFTIGSDVRVLPAPPLVKNIFLQSFAPVITAGQGGDRPIDASLGNAVELVNDDAGFHPPADAQDVVVPVDSVIVLQMQGPPGITWVDSGGGTHTTQTFTEPLEPAPGPPDDGFIPAGGDRRVRYVLKEIRLDHGLSPAPGLPPAAWRRLTRPEPIAPGEDEAALPAGADTNLDLALFSRAPFNAPYALERSSDLEEIITTRWENLCDPVAPPTCVLWVFCGQRLGPSGSGWQINGIPQPDPPGTIRTSPAPTRMAVEEPLNDSGDYLLGILGTHILGSLYIPARIVGSESAPFDKDKLFCERALRLPMNTFEKPSKSIDGVPVDQLTEYLKTLEREFVTFHTGQVLSASFLVAVPVEFVQGFGELLVRQLDHTGAVLDESNFLTFSPTQITGVTGLPPTWTDPASPWADRVTVIASFLGSQPFPNLLVFFFTVKPEVLCESIQLAIRHPERAGFKPIVLVGALETCPQSEVDRAESAEAIRQGEIRTVDGYINGNDPIPLLLPNTHYTLTVIYDALSREADGSENLEENLEQRFTFTTDDDPPPSLDSRILATTPDHNGKLYFSDDPVKIVFNDLSAVQLYAAYGYQLRLAVRTADGVPVTLPDPLIETLEPTQGELSGPYRDLLRALVEAGFLPCSGEVTDPVYGTQTVDIELRPSMSYTMDIEGIPPGHTANPRLLLSRCSFTTSEFSSLADLAGDVHGRSVRHRALQSAIAGLPLPGVDLPVPIAPDQDIEQALIAAGETALPPPGKSGVTVYWAPRADGRFLPHAILIDAVEPVWRSRVQPVLETVPDQTDPNFKRAVLGKAALLVVEESGGPRISHFVHSPSGTRTVAFFLAGYAPPLPGGESVVLELHRPASTLFSLAEESAALVDIVLHPTAPWEEEND